MYVLYTDSPNSTATAMFREYKSSLLEAYSYLYKEYVFENRMMI